MTQDPKSHITVISFGYLRGRPPSAHITLDLRTHFRDLLLDTPALLGLIADDRAVVDAVLATPGIPALINATEAAVHAYQADPPGPLTIAVGSAAGRRRAPTVASVLATRLRAHLTHRDLHHRMIKSVTLSHECNSWPPMMSGGAGVYAMVWSHDSRWLATCSGNYRRVAVWDMTDPAHPKRRIPRGSDHPEGPTRVVWNDSRDPNYQTVLTDHRYGWVEELSIPPFPYGQGEKRRNSSPDGRYQARIEGSRVIIGWELQI